MNKTLKESIKRYLPYWAVRYYRSLRQGLYLELGRARVCGSSEISNILKENWRNYKYDPYPIDRRMRVLNDKQIAGMCSENIGFMINEIVKRFAKGGAYLEVGSYMGYSLSSAALYNPSTRCVGIDNFSTHDPKNENEKILKENLKKLGLLENVEFHNRDYMQAFELIRGKEPDLKIAVYYYDGDHLYEEQIKGLSLALPFLSERCVIIVDDLNYDSVEDANRDFISKNPDFKSVFKIKTKGLTTLAWWNGLEIITRGI